MASYFKDDHSKIFEFAGFLLSMIGSLLIANKIQEGWYLYMLANIAFIVFAYRKKMSFLMMLNIWFMITNVIAIYNYIIK
jgi:hypothetical protein